MLKQLVVVGLVGMVSLAATAALAQEMTTPIAVNGVTFTESSPVLRPERLSFEIAGEAPARFSNLAPFTVSSERGGQGAHYELEFVARGAALGGMDVSLAQRGGFGFDAAGNIARESRSSELRLGRGLRGLKDDRPALTPTWYFFAASEDEALIWRPGQRNAFGTSSPSFALQDRVEIGDLQAGITYEYRGVQASLAYVEREINVRSGAQNFSQDERFAGFTLTMRR